MSRTARFLEPFIALIAAWVLRALIRTWRVTLCGPDPNALPGPFVFCFWHGNQAGLLAHPRVRPAAVMTSLSRDGALQTRILNHLGFETTRGSSSRGGAAGLLGLIEKLREGKDVLFAVDGPRGPLHVIKPGALKAASSAGVPLIALRAEANRAWVFSRSWDRYTLPKPFARLTIHRSAPIASDHPREAIEDALARELRTSF